MTKFFYESMFEHFDDGFFELVDRDQREARVFKVKAKRSKDLALVIKLKSWGGLKEAQEDIPAGTVRQSTNALNFRHKITGWTCAADAVVYRGYRTRPNAESKAITTSTFTANSLEINFNRQEPAVYAVDWVQNLPDTFIWDSPSRFDTVTTFTRTVGKGAEELKVKGKSEKSAGGNSLHFCVAGIDIYVLGTGDKAIGEGCIVYRGNPDAEIRKKVRICLSFALGQMIVNLGHTEYTDDWMPTFMKSVDAMSMDGKIFKNVDIPPYPFNKTGSRNIGSREALERVVSALFKKFDDLKFNELSWCYWYAVCAPMHAAPVQFGALIEQLQRNIVAELAVSRTILGREGAWASLKQHVREWFDKEAIEPELRTIVSGKLSILNQAPQGTVLLRVLEKLGLELSEAEQKAWKHRNGAAHGEVSDDPVSLILGSKLLRILFHRMIAGITGCSGLYHDFYSIGHPTRSIRMGVPERKVPWS